MEIINYMILTYRYAADFMQKREKGYYVQEM